MTLPAQTVIYRLDPAHDPEWQFYSMPESIIGGGKCLDEARAEYRDALAFSLDTDVLPEVREYVEREIGNLGIWMRLPIDHPNFNGVLSDVRRQITSYPEDRDWFFANTTAGGDPVIVTASPDAPLSSILDQMTIYDSLILAMLYRAPGKSQNDWLSLVGAEAVDETEEAATSFEAMGLTPDSPLRDLLAAAMERQVNKISALAHC
ncbi:hypothetical protein H7H78_01980 [Mycobacterium shinjukuense]|uniref:Uncharacterized protein n=1 Tax=Mycobacterium shinjukuense TaxID=398694 RepID=A0A7I7MQJ8_9MYCO|nr:hypothetical protein [Mycobacterium shinjukuense]MCV6984261.1 hypothetical protein [Mycobacterium shinjukuense]ORB65873.1 hypothetical protein BST45_14600 [Mycobacterium shinjukuense]BBX74220.1 hypothetical protein MSHI_21260 [Mycobacterium shinjukuense]